MILQKIIFWYVILIHYVIRNIIKYIYAEQSNTTGVITCDVLDETRYLKWEANVLKGVYILPYIASVFYFTEYESIAFKFFLGLAIVVAILRSIEHINPRAIS
ncbi:MAG TPA: hypothetical protein VIK77_08175 [Tissierellaceae bacterium]